MLLTVNNALLDACVLSLARREDTYGYRITQMLTRALGVSESALYPVLRRLQKEGALTTYDVAISGRNRRYYRLSPQGRQRLEEALSQWELDKAALDAMLYRGTTEESEEEPYAGQTKDEG